MYWTLFRGLVTLWSLSEVVLQLVRRAGSSTDTHHDGGTLTGIFLAIAGGLTLGIFTATSGIALLPATIARPLGWIGIGCLAAGMILRFGSVWTLRRFFTVSVAIRADHQVVQDGPYRYVRHPSYAGAILSFVGVGLCLGSWLAFLLVVVPTTASLLYRIRVEEAALHAALGPAWAEYAARTARLVPFVY